MGTIVFKQRGRYGRLGNAMFQIASTIGIARNSGNFFAFPYWKNYDALDRFNASEDIDMQKHFVHPLPIMDESLNYRNFDCSWGYHEFPIGDENLNLIGHMQSEKYFKDCKNLVRHFLTMKQPERYYKPEDGTAMVAIHLRCGDYDDNYHPIMSREYYEEAISIMKSLGLYKFCVYSDDLDKAKTIFDGLGDIVYADSYGTIEDLYSMSQCSHFIIANSTYSWWGAWLSKNESKVVIAPKKWFGIIAGISSEDIYCKNWIVI